MRIFASTSTFALALTSLLAACSDDGGMNTQCLGGGHGGAKPTCGPWANDVPEGGEFRIELQKFGTDGSTTAATHGYFFKDQMPLRRDLEGPELVAGTGCTDATGGRYFDNGSPPEAQAIAASRTYLDLGATAAITSPEPSMNGNERGCEWECERGRISPATCSIVGSRPAPARGSGTW